jgi:hypothetical protein
MGEHAAAALAQKPCPAYRFRRTRRKGCKKVAKKIE